MKPAERIIETIRQLTKERDEQKGTIESLRQTISNLQSEVIKRGKEVEDLTKRVKANGDEVRIKQEAIELQRDEIAKLKILLSQRNDELAAAKPPRDFVALEQQAKTVVAETFAIRDLVKAVLMKHYPPNSDVRNSDLQSLLMAFGAVFQSWNDRLINFDSEWGFTVARASEERAMEEAQKATARADARRREAEKDLANAVGKFEKTVKQHTDCIERQITAFKTMASSKGPFGEFCRDRQKELELTKTALKKQTDSVLEGLETL